MMRLRNIAMFLLVFVATILLMISPSMAQFNPNAVPGDPGDPAVLVGADQDLYFLGDNVELWAVPLKSGLPGRLDFVLRIEREETVFPGINRDMIQPQGLVPPQPGSQKEWVPVETHIGTFRPSREPIRTYPGAVNDLEPFIRIPISETDQAWGSGLYRIRVQPNFGAMSGQTIYFRIDCLDRTPVPEVQLVGRNVLGLQLKFGWQVPGWFAVAFDRSGRVATQRLAFYGESAETFLQLGWGLGVGPVSVVLYDPTPTTDEDGQATATYLLR